MSNTSDRKKVIKNNLGLLKFADTLGNVNGAYKVMGYSGDSTYRFKEAVRNRGKKQRLEIFLAASHVLKTALITWSKMLLWHLPLK